jgi:riboflavin-specific deaminase-like protein
VVTLSYAQSFDGSLTDQRGWGMALSCAESKLMTHQLRAAHSGILVGIGTVLADDPLLSARLAGGPHPQPVVLDSNLRIPMACRLLGSNGRMPWIFCAEDAPWERKAALENLGARVFILNRGADGRLDLRQALTMMRLAGLSSLMVEGGARVIGSFLAGRLADQAVVTLAPLWAAGLPAAEGKLLHERTYPVWVEPVCERFGRDWVFWGKLGEGFYETSSPVFPGAGTS